MATGATATFPSATTAKATTPTLETEAITGIPRHNGYYGFFMPSHRFWILLLAIAVPLNAAEKFDVRANYSKLEYRIPMRDGVKLFTIAYVPKDPSERYPILLTRTPYNIHPYGPDAYRDNLGPGGTKFEQDRFIFVYQDVRGRYMSEGEFVDARPIKTTLANAQDTDESTDTYDTIDWLLHNVPNNNGKVGLLGTSYSGFYTACGMVRAHPALLAASPQAPMADLYMGDDSYHNGAFFLLANFGFYTTFAKQNNPQLPPEKEPEFNYGTNDGYRFYLRMGSVSNSDKQFLHYTDPYWTDTYAHTTYDSFWQARNILPHLKTSVPAVLVVGGWFDAEDLSGTLKTFRAIDRQSPTIANTLVMGPWAHGAWNRPGGEKLGDIPFGSDTTSFFRDNIELPFFRHYLKGAPDPSLPKAWVFETGKNEWKKLPQWPPTDARPQRIYFHALGKLALQPPTEADGYDQYRSDPNNPVPFFPKPTTAMDIAYMDGDQRFLEGRNDVLTYITEPLTDDLTVAGPVSPDLFVSTTGADSDFDVKLIDVYPPGAPNSLGGYQQLVRGEPFRGKFRNSFEKPEPFQSGVPQEIRFTMPDIYHCFLKNHRIMVQIQSSWFPLTDRNPQTFTDIPNARPDEFIQAIERLFRSARMPSSIELNVETSGS